MRSPRQRYVGAPPTPRRFALIWNDPTLRMLVLSLMVFGGFAASTGVFQSLIAITVFGLSDQQFSLIMVAILIVSASASVGIGILTDQRPSRRLMALMAAAAMTLAAVIVFAAPTTFTFVIAHALLIPLSSTIFGQIFAVARLVLAPYGREDRDAALTIVRAAFAVPFVIVLPLWGLAFSYGVPVMTIYPVLIGVGAVLIALVAFRWPADAVAPWTEVKSGIGFRASIAEMTHGPVLVRVMLIGSIHVGSTLSGVLLGLVFDAASGRGPSDVAMFFGIFVALEVFFTLQVWRALRIMRRLYVIATGVAVYAGYIALLPVLAETPAVWLLTIPAGIGSAFIFALAIGYLQDLLGSRAGAGSSLIALQRVAADGLSAGIFALGSWLAGYWLVAILGSVCMLAAMGAILWLDRYRPLPEA